MKIEKQNLQPTNIHHVKCCLEITTHFGGVWQQSVHRRENSLLLYYFKMAGNFKTSQYVLES